MFVEQPLAPYYFVRIIDMHIFFLEINRLVPRGWRGFFYIKACMSNFFLLSLILEEELIVVDIIN